MEYSSTLSFLNCFNWRNSCSAASSRTSSVSLAERTSFWHNLYNQTSQNKRTVTTIPFFSSVLYFIMLPYRNFDLLKLRSVDIFLGFYTVPFYGQHCAISHQSVTLKKKYHLHRNVRKFYVNFFFWGGGVEEGQRFSPNCRYISSRLLGLTS